MSVNKILKKLVFLFVIASSFKNLESLSPETQNKAIALAAHTPFVGAMAWGGYHLYNNVGKYNNSTVATLGLTSSIIYLMAMIQVSNYLLIKDLFNEEKASKSLDDILLDKETREKIDKVVESFNTKNPTNCILLYGPPGTGKTSLANAIAKKINAKTISLSMNNISNDKYSENSKYYWLPNLISSLIYEPKKTPSNIPLEYKIPHAITTVFGAFSNLKDRRALIIDEIDAFYSASGSIKNMFQTNIENFPKSSILIATTNNPSTLKAALKRSGRLESISIGNPTKEVRSEMFKANLINEGLDIDKINIDYDILSNLSENLSGATIEKIVQNAVISKEKNLQKSLETEIKNKKKENQALSNFQGNEEEHSIN